MEGETPTQIDLQEELGAEAAFSVQKITFYIPNRDCSNDPVDDVEKYIQAAMRLLVDINSGVTRLPPSEGMWTDGSSGDQEPESEPQFVYEETTLIYSFITDPAVFIERLREIREFLHRFGRETNQGEVFVEYTGERPDGSGMYSRAYSIKEFDPPMEV